ncbi:MAG: MFS transporter [Candidatus Heimdallarchaeaceae archaeon]
MNTEITKKKRFFMERNEILILTGIFFLGISTAMFSPYAPIWLTQIFDVERNTILGFVAIIPYFVIAIGTTVWGIMSDKFGNKRFVFMGFIAAGLMYFTLMFINNPYTFLAVMLVGYIFISGQTSNIYSYATLTSSKRKEVILGEIAATFSLAWLVASPIAALIHDNAANFSLNWYSSASVSSIVSLNAQTPTNGILNFAIVLSKFFSNELVNHPAQGVQLFIAIVSCAIASIFILFTKEERREKKQAKEQESKKMGKLTEFKLIFVVLMLVAFFQNATSGGFWSYASLYFIDFLRAPAVYFSYFLIGTTTIGVVLSLLLGRLTKIRRITAAVMSFIFLQILIYLLMTLFPLNVTLGLIVYSFPTYVISTICLTSLVGTFSNKIRRATAFGLFNTIGIAGSISATLLMGFVADRSPKGLVSLLGFALGFSICTFVLAIILSIIIERRKHLI